MMIDPSAGAWVGSILVLLVHCGAKSICKCNYVTMVVVLTISLSNENKYLRALHRAGFCPLLDEKVTFGVKNLIGEVIT